MPVLNLLVYLGPELVSDAQHTYINYVREALALGVRRIFHYHAIPKGIEPHLALCSCAVSEVARSPPRDLTPAESPPQSPKPTISTSQSGRSSSLPTSPTSSERNLRNDAQPEEMGKKNILISWTDDDVDATDFKNMPDYDPDQEESVYDSTPNPETEFVLSPTKERSFRPFESSLVLTCPTPLPGRWRNILLRTFATSCYKFEKAATRQKAKSKLAPGQRGRRNEKVDGKSTKEEQPSQLPVRRFGSQVQAPNLGPAHSKPDPEEPVIRWYQQLTPWSKHRRLADPDHPDLNEDNVEVKWLKKEIDRLEEELQEMRGEGKSGKTLIEPLLQGLSPEDQQFARDHIKKEELREAARTKALAQWLPKLEIKYAIPLQHQVYLRHLNTNIRKATIRIGDYRLRRNLWQSYARCKAFLPPFLHLIPNDSWAILYNAQVLAMTRDDPNWARHLITLLGDMKSIGKQLQPDQIMVYIEALRFDGRQEEAIAEWQKLRKVVQGNQRASAEYELLGVRLFTSQGNAAMAEELASKYLETGDRSESRILIPIMDTWIHRRDDVGMKHAWALYLRLKMQLGSDITMDDYDSVSMSFLRGNRTDLALAVFKDMMLTGRQTEQGSVDLYRKSLGLVGKMHASAVSVEQLNRMSLTGLTVLPREFQNKFFYGSWMKKLIGLGEANAAASVVELMYERGVKPDPKHLNGIIGAWLRSRHDSDKDKAEQMAWAMIHQRIDFVKGRTHSVPTTKHSDVDIDVKTVQIPPHVRRTVSPANIETYCLLLHYYGRRAMQEKIQLVQAALEMGEVKPNNYWLNHLLYIDLHRGRHDLSWARYSGTAVAPDLETFAALWDCEKAHLDSLVIYRKDSFPGPRRIMHDMVSWFATRSDKERRLIRQDFSRELYYQIIRCFSQAQDLQGTLAALYALKESFGYYPDANTNDTISIQVARMGIITPEDIKSKRTKKRTTLRHAHKARKQANELRTMMALHLVQFKRSQTLAAAGYDDFEELNEKIQREERLFVLAEYLRTIIRKTMISGEEDIEASIKRAASEMGVMGLKMEDPLPYN
ncbi:MAG: hypothetical protein Q9163_000563 [Psora crenata]